MIIHDTIIQGSDEWKLIRLGKITASEFSDVLNAKAGRGTYMRRLAAERLTGEPVETYKNGNMQAGNDNEAAAREYYEALYQTKVKQVGFVSLDDFTGCSPDGLIGDDGVLEIKCPLSSTHVSYILEDRLPTQYVPQVQGILWVTERKWCDFISFCPKMKARKIFVKRVYRDEKDISILAAAVDLFKIELQKMIEKIDNPFNGE
jgi:hypothetical protein